MWPFLFSSQRVWRERREGRTRTGLPGSNGAMDLDKDRGHGKAGV